MEQTSCGAQIQLWQNWKSAGLPESVWRLIGWTRRSGGAGAVSPPARGKGAGDRARAFSARALSPRAGRSGSRAGVSADDGKAQQHFEQSLGKRAEKKEEEIVLVVCLVISSHV